MKGKRKHRETGGADEAEEDLKTKPERRGNPATKIDDEAEEMKKGGKAKKHRARGGKNVGVISGSEPPAHAGRKPRKAGGRTYSDSNPFTSANKGTDPKGHKTAGTSKLLEGMDSGRD